MPLPDRLRSWDPKPGELIEGTIIELRTAQKEDRYRIAVIDRIERDADGEPWLTGEVICIHGAWPRLRASAVHWRVGMAITVRYIGKDFGGKVHDVRVHEITKRRLIPDGVPVPPTVVKGRIKRRREA